MTIYYGNVLNAVPLPTCQCVQCGGGAEIVTADLDVQHETVRLTAFCHNRRDTVVIPRDSLSTRWPIAFFIADDQNHYRTIPTARAHSDAEAMYQSHGIGTVSGRWSTGAASMSQIPRHTQLRAVANASQAAAGVVQALSASTSAATMGADAFARAMAVLSAAAPQQPAPAASAPPAPVPVAPPAPVNKKRLIELGDESPDQQLKPKPKRVIEL